MSNPLLDFSGLPRFSGIRPEHVGPAMEQLLVEARTAMRAAEDAAPTWERFVQPLERATERLSRAWGQVEHLHAVLDSPALREAYNASLPKITQFWTELGQNQHLFEKYRDLKASAAFAPLPPARKKLVENALRDFRLGGAELPAEVKPRYAAIQAELASLSAKFSENVLDATNAYSIVVEDEKRLAGIPEDDLQAAREAAQKEGKKGWKFNLQMPSYFPVMQYAKDRALRETLYRESATRASEFGKAEWDNTPLIARTLKLRKEDAGMLGYSSFAEVSLVPKMAQSAKQVIDFLRDLAARARPFAERDLVELRDFGRTELGLDRLESWDLAFASEKLRAQRYAFSDQEVKQYFPESQVLPGMFDLVQRLYQVRIDEQKVETWHEDVRFFDVRNAHGVGNELIGRFYVDLYARDTKRGGAWMDGAISRRRLESGIQVPVAYLNCNFSRPVGGKPALFTHDEVITLFHEFGHGLHHLLTQVEDLGVAGINGVEWDAVELPSQFMENFCWEWEVLERMTRHVDSGQALPRALYDKMLAAKNFQSGLATLRQIEFALFDMRLHSDFDPESGRAVRDGSAVLDLLAEVRREVAVMVPPDWNRFPNSFSHI